MTPLLSGRAIRRQYSPRPEDEVLKGIDIDIFPGEILAIVGPSGVGKTTLLNILGLLDTPTSGTVIYEGREASYRGKNLIALPSRAKARVRNHQLGFVFQLYHLLPDLTVLENVMLPALVGAGLLRWRAVKRSSRERAARLLEEVGIADRSHARPSELSGGEKQRAAIARALVLAPEIVLCDEPTGNLDTATGERIHSLLSRLNREHRMTMVVVTHEVDLARKADRILRMVDGRFVGEERASP
jgi:ABC-type lipoprotein export system ATPase subunit